MNKEHFLRLLLRAAPAAILLLFLLPARAVFGEVLTLEDLRDCRRIISLSLKYSWVESPSARIFSKHHYVFLNGRYEGYAYSAVKSKALSEVNKLDNLVVPPGVMQAIAIILKDSPLTKVEESPAVEALMRHPHYEISMELCTEGIKFFTYSAAEEGHWAVTLGGDTYLIGNDAPDNAIKVLEPFMHFEIVTDLKERAFGKEARPQVKPKEVVKKGKTRSKLKRAPKPFQNILFGFDEYSIRHEYNIVLFGIVDYIRMHPATEIVVEGHCDERGDESYNIALGEKRASSVISHLINLGAISSRIKSISYGEQKPVALGHTEEDWKRNRRVEFYLYEYE